MRNKKKIAALAIAAALVVGTGTAAFAYWTISGSGNGSASTGTSVTSLTVTADSFSSANLKPGGPTQTLSGSVKNTDDATVRVNKVTASITSVTPVTGSTCAASNYSIVDAEMALPANTDLAKNATISFSGAKLQMVNTTANQDGCKGATVNLKFDAS